MAGESLLNEMERFSCLNFIPVGVFVIDRDYKVLFWNRCLESWTGIAAKEIGFQDIRERFPHLGTDRYAARLESVFRGGSPIVFSSQLHQYAIPAALPNGSMRLQHTTVNAVRTASGDGFNALFSLQDVTDIHSRIRDYVGMRDMALAELTERRKAETTLQEHNHFLQTLIDTIPHGVFYMTVDGIYQGCNRTYEEHLGLKKEEIIGKSNHDIFPAPLADRHHEADTRLFDRVGKLTYESSLLSADGEERVFLITKASFTNVDGTIGGLVGNTVDITERKVAERLLRQEKLFSDSLFDLSPSGTILINSRREIVRINDAALRTFGRRRDEVLGRQCIGLICPCEGALCPADGHGGQVSVSESVVLNKAGEKVPVIKSAARVPREEETYFIESFIDISDRKRTELLLMESEKRYRELSITDGLTGLYNLRYFYDQLGLEIERACRYGHSLSLMLFDVDDFKRHNDKYGHIEGDKALIVLAEVIRACLRQNDSAYRYGGEEFIILLPETEGEKALIPAERIRKAFSAHPFFPRPGEEVRLTVSIGIAQYTPPEELPAFVRRADKAMYGAKTRGKNRVFFPMESPGADRSTERHGDRD